jgi:DNA-binding transcriptional regulator GbsR (MarR family)
MPIALSPANEEIMRKYVSRTGQMFETYGFPRIFGQMGALLYLHRGPLSLDDIASFLGVSKGSISSNGRALIRMKYVKLTPMAGDRKDYYEFSGNLWSSLSEAADSFIHSEVQDFQDLNAECSPVLETQSKKGGADSEDLQHMCKQIKDLDELFRFIFWLASLIKSIKSTPLGKIPTLLSRFFKK